MIIPIRCFTCNKVIAHLWEEYLNKIQIAYIDEDIKNHTTINFKESYTKKNKNINKNSDHDLSKFDDEKMRCDLKK